jgi:Fe-S-cluster containining protein
LQSKSQIFRYQADVARAIRGKAMGLIQFKCEKCGFCCRTLLQYESEYLVGLSLFPEETKLFDPKIVVPFMAFGISEPTTITSYQLTVAVCPHINERNECNIYENRPLICKAFPIIPAFPHTKLAPKCPQISHHSTYRENGNTLFDDKQCEDAIQEISVRVMTRIQREKGAKLWLYDLTTKKWIMQN